MNQYDMDMLNWIAEATERAAAMARVRTALAKMPASALRQEMLRYLEIEHKTLVDLIEMSVRDYLDQARSMQK